MRILVTRPQEAAERVAARLGELGHEALIAPLLTVRFLDGPPLDLDGVQGVLATSANGVRALARRTTRRDLPVFAVGPQTALAARQAGFLRVENAKGDAAALAEAVPHWAKPQAGALLYAMGAEGKNRLGATLAASGYEVRSIVLYEVVAVAVLPEAAARALKEGSLEAALFFSPRSARVFAACVAKAGLAQACARIAAVCISRPAAGALAPLDFAAIRVAERPNQDALLVCLK